MSSFDGPKVVVGRPQDSVPARCPFCGQDDTELCALFGSQLSTSQHYCHHCHVVFEQIKWSTETDRSR